MTIPAPRRTLMAMVVVMLVGLLIPAVSAEVLYDENIETFEFTGGSTIYQGGSTGAGSTQFDMLYTQQIRNIEQLYYVGFDFDRDLPALEEGSQPLTYTIEGQNSKSGTMRVTKFRNILGSVTHTQVLLFFDDWDIELLSGEKSITFTPSLGKLPGPYGSQGSFSGDSPFTGKKIGNVWSYTITTSCSVDLKNHIQISDDGITTTINLQRVYDDKSSLSELIVYNTEGNQIYYDHSANDLLFYVSTNTVKNITLNLQDVSKVYTLTQSPGVPPTPPPTVLRTGSVTMTDHNGTTITGFEVTAVNHYTGESYNVSTDTDVAVMTLPMERTTEIRNPQTGVYETAPIGYYRFYGQAPGYRMLNEDGIQVAVMPEKYGSYKLCDIGVMSDSGPLTGKHKFQIRSRSDNSILQTGTISAKSRTTGIWYNTTVVDGLATLILAYDSSDAISEYAGQYYVYATSPGYEDSDFGTQISVHPHTVSEIRTIFLTPIGGVPTPGNVTLRIQAMSETGQGVVNAEIFIAGVLGEGYSVWDTYFASSTGYLAVSVPGNSTYDIVARGAGYYDSSRRIQVFTDDPDLIEMRLYLSGAPTIEPTDEPTGWPTDPPSTQPTGGIPDDDDDSDGFLVQAVRGIGLAFGVGFSTAKIIFGMLLALAIGFATAKQLRGGAAEFGMGLLGGTMLGVLIGLLPVWIIVVLLLVVGLYIGNRYVGGNNNG